MVFEQKDSSCWNSQNSRCARGLPARHRCRTGFCHHWGNYALSGLTSVTDIYQDLNHHTRNEEPLLIPSSDIDVMSQPLTSRNLFHGAERREGAPGDNSNRLAARRAIRGVKARAAEKRVDSRVRQEPVTFLSELFIWSPESTFLSGICFFAPKFNPRELAHQDFQKSNCRRKETLRGEGSLHSLHQSPPPKRLLCMRGGSSLKLETHTFVMTEWK